ncbi:MAG: quinone oxidoreductase [Azospirillaceae bacterium]|nr:quinone oxidoreductase [Azospirillaceae bacterium]
MVQAIRIHKTGGPEVLTWENVAVDAPPPGAVRLRQTAVGLNFIDIYFRSGLYPATLPLIPGQAAAGVVEAIGDGVSDLKVGDRVAYAGVAGSYAEARIIPAKNLVPLPATIDDRQAAASLLQGMTAQYLLCSTYRVQPGETIVVHAAAGGVGLILCQWARKLGVTTIGIVSTDEKAEIARQHGCTHAVVSTREDWVARVREITDGAGVPVVYDSVGKATFTGSLDCLKPRGLMVCFGNASGAVDGFNLGILASKGSLYVTRPTLTTYTASRAELLASAAAFFDVVESGDVRLEVNQSFALRDAADAHRALESRKTTGSTVLVP